MAIYNVTIMFIENAPKTYYSMDVKARVSKKRFIEHKETNN